MEDTGTLKKSLAKLGRWADIIEHLAKIETPCRLSLLVNGNSPSSHSPNSTHISELAYISDSKNVSSFVTLNSVRVDSDVFISTVRTT
jgi:hypothetical protein